MAIEENSVGIVQTQTLDIPLKEDFKLRNGGSLPELTVAYEAYGRLSETRDNVVYICTALTGDAHAAGYHSEDEEKPGWWDQMIGPGKGIDTNYYYVICANILGGCQGTTGPCSVNPQTGEPYGVDFPEVTVTDIVNVQKLFLEALGIERLAAAIGGSFGGMQVLEWSIRHPESVDRCICIAAAASLSAQALAFDVVARDAITSDPNWQDGKYYENGNKPEWGLAHARKIGHITYLSPEIMQKKFGREKVSAGEGSEDGDKFQVESYLDYQGRKLVERFDANSYLLLTRALESYDLAEEYGSVEKAFEKASSKFLVVALSSDWLFPPEQSLSLANSLLKAGREVACCTLEAPYGHDA
jgi:homoserine O-acetyltransferase